MAARALFLAAVAMVAGCAAPEDPPADAPLVLARDAGASACERVLTVVLVPVERAEGLLPEGYRAGDAQRFFGTRTPVPSQRGVVAVSAADCAGSAWSAGGHDEGFVAVFVEPPEVDGVEAARTNFYELGAAGAGPFADTLAEVGWPVVGSDVEVAGARATIADVNGTLIEIGGALVPPEQSFEETIRRWRETSLGTGWLSQQFQARGELGAGSCAAAPGSVLAEAIGATECPPETVTLAGPPFDIEGSFEFRPGLRVAG